VSNEINTLEVVWICFSVAMSSLKLMNTIVGNNTIILKHFETRLGVAIILRLVERGVE
jgi:hypothetical protein